jgi:hypothetical protein
MTFDDLAGFAADPAVTDTAATVAWTFAAEAAGNAAALAEQCATLAGPAARACVDWAAGPGLDYLATGAEVAADGVVDGIAYLFDGIWAAVDGASRPIDATGRARHTGHPAALDRPRR